MSRSFRDVVDKWRERGSGRENDPGSPGRGIGRFALSLLVTIALSVILVFLVELIGRGSVASSIAFIEAPDKVGLSTIVVFVLALVALDAFIGRAHISMLVIAPCVLALAWISHEKTFYLGDPLYPVDLLYTRQIVDILPLLARQRPFTMAAALIVAIAAITILVAAFVYWRRARTPLSWRGRGFRLLLALPALIFFASIMDYSTFSWARDRLGIIPMMWDQQANYDHNGFTAAFILNVPMADVKAPKGYAKAAMKAIAAPSATQASAEKPDVIMVMNESFWDATRLPNTTITPDPIPTVRALRSGYMFSPEFGGTTANIEFEALTGFSNAFLPYGSIPYQQYIRRPTPSLATFFKSQGYITRALHPYQSWFWNRSAVYKDFGFDDFMSVERMPPLAKRGPLVSDAAFVNEIIREADQQTLPFFFFAVTLQNHGPYEAHRYAHSALTVKTSASEASRQAILTYAEGTSDGNKALAHLMDWAKHRKRPTIIMMWGDHLPPLGPVYVETGFMKQPVAPRLAPLATMRVEHETPLVVWSNRSGAERNIGTVSPSLLPLYLLRLAGFKHPYYTGFLGEIDDKYRVVDRNMLMTVSQQGIPSWSRQPKVDPLINQYRLLEYDEMFGKKYAAPSFFPETVPPKPGS